MSLMFAKQFSEAGATSGGGGGRKGGRSKGGGLMSKSKRGARGGLQDDATDAQAGGIFSYSMDPNAPYRTHMLFPGRKDEEMGGDTRKPSGGSPSFMKAVMGWGKRTSDSRSVGPSQELQTRPGVRSPESELLDPDSPFFRKQVSFHDAGNGRTAATPVRPERRIYHDENPMDGTLKNGPRQFIPYNEPFNENDYASFQGGGGGGGLGGGLPPGAPPRGRRGPMTREEAARLREEELAVQAVAKDCFIIPQANLERFLPDGVTLPREPRKQNNFINIVEVDDPKIIVSFHLMGQLSPLNTVLENPLANPMNIHLKLCQGLLQSAEQLSATEGFLLKNLEKDADYPFINYYVINKPRKEAGDFYQKNKVECHQILEPRKLGYSTNHSMDLYDEVATIARPPVDPTSKKPTTDSTGYIICIYQVFKGDDGEKFERNWLYWTGARMLYKNLPRNVGLKRLTLHKSATGPQVNYILLVECSHFLDNINQAANLLPVLRARICGYTGIFRVVESF